MSPLAAVRVTSLAAWFLVLLPGLTAQPLAAPSTRSRIQKKTYDFKEAGKEMEYALFVPSTYDKAKQAPLMVALHGLHSNPQQILRYPGLTDLAEKHGYIASPRWGTTPAAGTGHPRREGAERWSRQT
jgi:poly(3-hydroxybutyrate) depolymerase